MITTTERRFPVRLIQESDRLIQTRRWRATDSNHQSNAYARNLYLYLAKTVLSQTDAIPSAATSLGWRLCAGLSVHNFRYWKLSGSVAAVPV